jgi:hypothetical protein
MMTRPAVLTAIVLATFGAPLGAQQAQTPAAPRDPRAAQPERPTVATHAYAVAPGYVEVEAGGIFANPGGVAAATGPMNVKFGVVRWLQLNLTGGWVGGETSVDGPFRGGMADLTVSAKLLVGNDLPVLGDFAVQPSLKLPTGSETRGFGTGTTDGGLLLVSSHQVGPGEIDVNAGWTVRSGDGTAAPKSSAMWAVAGGVPLGSGIGWTSEVFGYPGTSGPAGGGPQLGLLFGPTFALHRWLILDAGAIVNLQGLGANSGYLGVTANLGRWF